MSEHQRQQDLVVKQAEQRKQEEFLVNEEIIKIMKQTKLKHGLKKLGENQN
ncbi:hypothetical protein [Priestia aryabhattai]|uniref:hypothetical protein n=1 Tax=Priestia aryabhattai TaxID=412384 RepID=UPI0036DC7A29